MEIKDDHIKEAEKFLINGKEFDRNERIPFIKKLDSCDLLAVPGSGKTTALLAKLYCLSKHLPFKDGSGILVLSHTNAAVDEIEEKLKKHCPKVFHYPNYIGTVQSFINKFLVTPCYSQAYGRILCIDDDIYFKEIEKKLTSERRSEIAYFKCREPGIFFNARFWLNEHNETILWNGILNKPLTLSPPHKWINDGDARLKIENVKNFITNSKKDIIKKGILSYHDCYFIATKFILRNFKLGQILRNRFRYVFIDEMQDLEKYQINLIDKIFGEGSSGTVIQRIGDVNQSIYNSYRQVKVETDWQPRNQIYLNGSNRLTRTISSFVNHFTLDRQQNEIGNPRFVVNGLRNLDENINPYIILFNQQTKVRLIEKFRELIRDHNLNETNEGKKYGFKIIGWSAKWDEQEDSREKLRLEDIFESYKKTSGNKDSFNSLSKHLQCFDKDKRTLESARKAILNALVVVLRIENKTYPIKIRGHEIRRLYNSQELIRHIQEDQDSTDYELFKTNLYEWSFSLVTKKNYREVYNSIKTFIANDFTNWFNISLSRDTLNFLGDQFEEVINETSDSNSEMNHDDIKIDIGTVHSVKGQTHCATMYVETSYHKYETQKRGILNALKKQGHGFNLNTRNQVRGKEALKMMYVGFSRPTHLLCFAVLKENVNSDIESLRSSGWEIVDLTTSNN